MIKLVINSNDINHSTGMEMAAQRGKVEVLEVLLAFAPHAGLDIDSGKSLASSTFLSILARADSKKLADIVEVFVQCPLTQPLVSVPLITSLLDKMGLSKKQFKRAASLLLMGLDCAPNNNNNENDNDNDNDNKNRHNQNSVSVLEGEFHHHYFAHEETYMQVIKMCVNSRNQHANLLLELLLSHPRILHYSDAPRLLACITPRFPVTCIKTLLKHPVYSSVPGRDLLRITNSRFSRWDFIPGLETFFAENQKWRDDGGALKSSHFFLPWSLKYHQLYPKSFRISVSALVAINHVHWLLPMEIIFHIISFLPYLYVAQKDITQV